MVVTTKTPIHYIASLLPGDLVRVFIERTARWEGTFTVTKISKIIISVTCDTKDNHSILRQSYQ